MDHRRKIALIKDDKKYIWHPFTQMADWVRDEPAPPLMIASGRGVYLYDVDGKRYLDGVSSLWTTLHGHRVPEIDAALRRQITTIAHSTFLGLTHEPAIRLARELVRIAPEGLSRVFYSDNGSTAVEAALKMACQYWLQKEGATKRTTFLALRNAYHGDTIGSVSVGGMDLFHAKFRPLLFKPYFAPSPYCYRCAHKGSGQQSAISSQQTAFKKHQRRMKCKGQCLSAVENILERHSGKIAAAIIEPMIQAAAGFLAMPPGYMKGFEQLMRRYGVLLICDEVATGFGRTGKMFAVEHERIKPDLMCLSKAITGGYLPLAATLTTEEVYRAFLGRYGDFKTFFHGHTYTANPLGCAAALANLEIFRKKKVLSSAARKLERLDRELAALAGLPMVGEIRRAGFMTGIELVKDRLTGEEFDPSLKIGARVCAACRPRGLLIRPLGDVVTLLPPIGISERQITAMIGILRDVLTAQFSSFAASAVRPRKKDLSCASSSRSVPTF